MKGGGGRGRKDGRRERSVSVNVSDGKKITYCRLVESVFMSLL